jgi:hypothetical protein
MPLIRGAIDAGLPNNPQSLRQVPEEEAASRRKVPENLSAYDLCLRGMIVMDLLDREANQKAGEFFNKAIEQERNFALSDACKEVKATGDKRE